MDHMSFDPENGPIGAYPVKSLNGHHHSSLQRGDLSARKKLSQLGSGNRMFNTPHRSKLGNVSNTPVGGSHKAGHKLGMKGSDDCFVKPSNFGSVKKSSLRNENVDENDEIVSTPLPTLFEEEPELMFPIDPKQFAQETDPYCTARMFELDDKTIRSIASYSDDEAQKENHRIHTFEELVDMF